MATRGSIPEIMKRAGIDMLDPAEGLPVIRHALRAGYSGEAVVGRRLGILLEPVDPGRRLGTRRGAGRGRAREVAALAILGRSATTCTTASAPS